jgi:type III pantothenate kinase
MLLAVDVGNTNTVFGVFAGSVDSIVVTARASSRADRMPDEWYAILAPVLAASGVTPADITGMIISSVVPNVTRWLHAMGEERLGVNPIIVGVDLDLGLAIDYDNPSEVGADRLVNSIAAIAEYGAPVIAVDFGTAINFDVVNAHGAYIGGSLAPGLVVALDAMTSRAARLFTVELKVPPTAIARNTTQAIQSGVVLGYLSLIEGMLVRIKNEMQLDPPVVVTGGYGEIFVDASPMIDYFNPNLTINGLKIVYDRISQAKS